MKPARILISGLLNVETSVPVEGFPVPYVPVTYPDGTVCTAASGVALNLACALAALGVAPTVLAPVADDAPSALIRRALADAAIPANGLVPILPETPLSVVLHAPDGARRIYCDLKAAQSVAFPPDVARAAFAPPARPDLAILCNINYSRPLIPLARAAGVPVATDLHVVSDPDDAYDADFIRAADILFLSHEGLPCAPADFTRALAARSPAHTIVVTEGAAGATLWERAADRTTHLPATPTRPVANTVGAGDATLAPYIHHWLRGDAPAEALRKAMLFASWKIGESGGARGFPSPGTYSRLLAGVFQ